MGRGRGKQYYYTVYRKKDDKILAVGDADACAKQLGMKRNSFYGMIASLRTGRTKGYEIYRSDVYCEE